MSKLCRNEAQRKILERRAVFIGAALTSLAGCAPVAQPPQQQPSPPQGSLTSPPPVTTAEASPDSDTAASDASAPASDAAAPDADAGRHPKLVTLVCLSIRIQERVRFTYGSAALDHRARTLLDEVVHVLEDNLDVRIVLEGHRDPGEPRRYDGQSLALRRAAAVRDYLASRGVPADRLCTRDYGDGRPLAPPDTVKGRARNRRVDFRKVADGEICAPDR